MNQSGKKGKTVKNCGLINYFCSENDLKVTRDNPEEWLVSMGRCEEMPQRGPEEPSI